VAHTPIILLLPLLLERNTDSKPLELSEAMN